MMYERGQSLEDDTGVANYQGAKEQASEPLKASVSAQSAMSANSLRTARGSKSRATPVHAPIKHTFFLRPLWGKEKHAKKEFICMKTRAGGDTDQAR